MILPILFIAPSGNMGRGVYTSSGIEAGTVVEMSPVIVMTNDDRKLLDKTLLHDYIFEWGKKAIGVAWRWGMCRCIITRINPIVNMKWILTMT